MNSIEAGEFILSLYILPGMSYGVAYTQNISFSRSDTSNGAAQGSVSRLLKKSAEVALVFMFIP